MKQKYMVVDVAQCRDCNNCSVACKTEHSGDDHFGYAAPQSDKGNRWLNVERRERGVDFRHDLAYLPILCQHCEEARCEQAVPDSVKRRADGVVLIDVEKAIGNRKLVDSCPFGAIHWNEEKNVAQKCTLCADLLDGGACAPRCVESCPTGALRFYEMEPAEFVALAAREGIEGYRSAELKNQPHVLYKNLSSFTKNFISAGVLVNGNCFEGAKVTLKDKYCVLATQKTDFFGEFKFEALENGDYTLEIDAAGEKILCGATIDGRSRNLGFITPIEDSAPVRAYRRNIKATN